jgi:hypothetical protein
MEYDGIEEVSDEAVSLFTDFPCNVTPVGEPLDQPSRIAKSIAVMWSERVYKLDEVRHVEVLKALCLYTC